MGSPEPRSFSRGKRAISGSLVFIVFDKDALLETLLAALQQNPVDLYTAGGNLQDPFQGMDEWNLATEGDENRRKLLTPNNIKYLDQVPPFNISITAANEYGNETSMKIFGVQILNEGSGMSIDDMVIEKACSFVARKVEHIGYQKIRQNLGLGNTTNTVNPQTGNSNTGGGTNNTAY